MKLLKVLILFLLITLIGSAQTDRPNVLFLAVDEVVQQFVCKCGLDQRFLPFVGWSVAESPEGEEVASLHWS